MRKLNMKSSFRRQLLVLFLLISIIPLILLTIFNYSYTLSMFKKQTYQNDSRILNKVVENMDNMLQNIEDRIFSFYISDLVYTSSGRSENYAVALSERMTYEQQLLYNSFLTSDRLGIENIFFYNEQDKYLVDSLNSDTRTQSGEGLDWYDKALSADGELCWIAPTKDRPHEGSDRLRVALLMKDYRGNIMGALCVWIRNDSLYSQIQDINSGERGFTAVVSEKGELISSSNFTSAVSAYFDENSLSERLPDLADEQDISIGGENYQITTMVSPYTGWYFITANSQAEIIWQILSKLNVFAILLVLCVLVALVFAFIMSNALYRPIKSLKRAMQEAGEGNLDVVLTEQRNDEFASLYNGFNSMTASINKLVKELYELKLMKKDAELKVLQSQINPHFLYNTLDSMYWMSRLGRNEELSDMISAFSGYLKINLSKGKDIISIEKIQDEIIYYIKIQQYRFGDKIRATVEIDPELYSYSIIKFLLQPLVENAIFHGLEPKKQKRSVRVVGQLAGGYAEFEVIDDGVGMDAEQVVHLEELINRQESVEGYALYNVHHRLLHTYGPECGLHIESEVGVGTKVSFKIPLIPYREDNLLDNGKED